MSNQITYKGITLYSPNGLETWVGYHSFAETHSTLLQLIEEMDPALALTHPNPLVRRIKEDLMVMRDYSP